MQLELCVLCMVLHNCLPFREQGLSLPSLICVSQLNDHRDHQPSLMISCFIQMSTVKDMHNCFVALNGQENYSKMAIIVETWHIICHGTDNKSSTVCPWTEKIDIQFEHS
uniref:Uncharacterized protein n=1 Tax=Rhizophora mucronata TaxID=61149 RepID=A0A2P2MCB2_RHIMU